MRARSYRKPKLSVSETNISSSSVITAPPSPVEIILLNCRIKHPMSPCVPRRFPPNPLHQHEFCSYVGYLIPSLRGQALKRMNSACFAEFIPTETGLTTSTTIPSLRSGVCVNFYCSNKHSLSAKLVSPIRYINVSLPGKPVFP